MESYSRKKFKEASQKWRYDGVKTQRQRRKTKPDQYIARGNAPIRTIIPPKISNFVYGILSAYTKYRAKREGALDLEQPTLGQISTDNVSIGKINIELIFLAINFLIEIPSLIFNQISSKHKPTYALVAMLMSFMATLLSIIDLACKVRKKRVEWRWEERLPWFYHPSPSNKRFGTTLEFLGLACAISQSIVSAISYGLYLHHVDNPIKTSFLPLILSFGMLCCKLMENQNQNDIPGVTSQPEGLMKNRDQNNIPSVTSQPEGLMENKDQNDIPSATSQLEGLMENQDQNDILNVTSQPEGLMENQDQNDILNVTSQLEGSKHDNRHTSTSSTSIA